MLTIFKPLLKNGQWALADSGKGYAVGAQLAPQFLVIHSNSTIFLYFWTHKKQDKHFLTPNLPPASLKKFGIRP